MNTQLTHPARQPTSMINFVYQRSQARLDAQIDEDANVGYIDQSNQEPREVVIGAGLLQEIRVEGILGGAGNILVPGHQIASNRSTSVSVNDMITGDKSCPKDAVDNRNASPFSSFSSEEHKSVILNSCKEERKKEEIPTKPSDW